MATGTELAEVSQRATLSAAFAQRYAVDQKNVFALLRDTALKPQKDGTQATDAEVAAFMIVCNQYELNPFIKEIYGFISKGKMQYVISVDGWATLVNRQANLNGIEFEEHFDGDRIKAITCRIHRKDRALPTVVTEYFSECRRDTDTWKQWPIRMLRHKAMIQCSRIAFGLAGIMDEDEAERMEGNTFGSAPILDQSSKASPAIEDTMDRLGWNETKKRMARRNFGNDEAGFMAHLQAEVAKIGAVQQATRKPANGTSHAKQQTKQTEPEDETQDTGEQYESDTAAEVTPTAAANTGNGKPAAVAADW